MSDNRIVIIGLALLAAVGCSHSTLETIFPRPQRRRLRLTPHLPRSRRQPPRRPDACPPDRRDRSALPT